MITDTERAQKHTSPMVRKKESLGADSRKSIRDWTCLCVLQTRVTGTVPSGRLQGRPLLPPEVPRRRTESIRTNSTEADAPPLNGSPPD